MNIFLWNILLALAWVALTGHFGPVNLLTGFLLGYLTLWLIRRTVTPLSYFGKVPRVISFAFFFVWELFKANVRVTYEVLTPRHRMRPGIVAIPLDVETDSEITLLANLITLTPGTLSLDVSDDRRVLFVHAMYVDDADAFRHSIKRGFEQRVLKVFR